MLVSAPGIARGTAGAGPAPPAAPPAPSRTITGAARSGVPRRLAPCRQWRAPSAPRPVQLASCDVVGRQRAQRVPPARGSSICASRQQPLGRQRIGFGHQRCRRRSPPARRAGWRRTSSASTLRGHGQLAEAIEALLVDRDDGHRQRRDLARRTAPGRRRTRRLARARSTRRSSTDQQGQSKHERHADEADAAMSARRPAPATPPRRSQRDFHPVVGGADAQRQRRCA